MAFLEETVCTDYFKIISKQLFLLLGSVTYNLPFCLLVCKSQNQFHIEPIGEGNSFQGHLFNAFLNNLRCVQCESSHRTPLLEVNIKQSETNFTKGKFKCERTPCAALDHIVANSRQVLTKSLKKWLLMIDFHSKVFLFATHQLIFNPDSQLKNLNDLDNQKFHCTILLT